MSSLASTKKCLSTFARLLECGADEVSLMDAIALCGSDEELDAWAEVIEQVVSASEDKALEIAESLAAATKQSETPEAPAPKEKVEWRAARGLKVPPNVKAEVVRMMSLPDAKPFHVTRRFGITPPTIANIMAEFEKQRPEKEAPAVGAPMPDEFVDKTL